jgi:uncharacterized protein YydD (DUF2326 family)
VIHRIYSSIASFKSLELNPGLNVLIAKKESGASEKQTRNRAGKTSLIEIVHFLMGADLVKDSPFRSEALANQTFGMVFDLAGEKLRVERTVRQRSGVQVEGGGIPGGRADLSNSEWVDLLGEKTFGLHKISNRDGRTPTFRSLFAYFVRRQLSGAFSTQETINWPSCSCWASIGRSPVTGNRFEIRKGCCRN